MSKLFTIAEGLENMGAIRTGGQGSVYKARRIGPILSAVKLLPTPIAEESTEDKNYRQFVSEVEKLKKVNELANPNVVKILSSGITESGSLPFIEMEYIEGPDVCELISEQHDKIFALKDVIKLADQLASALAHCHRVGVKHGDIKSNNVKFNVHTGNYVLLDFGLSVMSDEARRSSMRHAGAIEFMAPEQNEGQMLFQTDVYSYGVVLYEIIGGQVPFPLRDNGETSRNTVMIAHLESPVMDVLTLRRQNLPQAWPDAKKEHEMQVPAWLINVVNKCLEKAPENRFGNGMDLQEAIFKNSLSHEDTNNTSLVLQAEKEQLKAALDQLEQKLSAQKVNNVYISKSVLKGALIAVLFLLFFSVYGMFHKTVVYQAVPADTTKYIPFPMRFQPPPVIKPAVTNTVRKKKPVVRKKKSRKKFLGIF
ncbi:serine/threonine protein kinase [Mucilaginibacter antarcticus]|uniref:Serine/threonine protein kinase n=1 Tax=Mucilaginibacter antarcticus TaxID=1855725 RepID=A0ABW5XJE3_9SPHI